MSIFLVKHGEEYTEVHTDQGKVEHCEYLVSGQSDVANLPGIDECAAGSVAYTADVNSMWMLGQDDTWHKVGG